MFASLDDGDEVPIGTLDDGPATPQSTVHILLCHRVGQGMTPPAMNDEVVAGVIVFAVTITVMNGQRVGLCAVGAAKLTMVDAEPFDSFRGRHAPPPN